MLMARMLIRRWLSISANILWASTALYVVIGNRGLMTMTFLLTVMYVNLVTAE
jgi:hypothetical protein